MTVAERPLTAAEGARHALLVLGPTGSGKSPLGDYLQDHGLHGQSCAHFDFGAALRGAAAGAPVGKGLSRLERAVVERVLAEGRLLEDSEFPIAETLLKGFIREASVSLQDLLVLNGLPRHEGQARNMAERVRVVTVVELRCLPEVVAARIRRNTGGDRAHRVDDSPEEVKNKLLLFEKETEPLLDYYRVRQTRIVSVEITEETQPDDIVRQLPRDGWRPLRRAQSQTRKRFCPDVDRGEVVTG